MPTQKVQFHKDIKRQRIRKSLSKRIGRLNKKESHFKTCNQESAQLEAGRNLENKVTCEETQFQLPTEFMPAYWLASKLLILWGLYKFIQMMYIDQQAMWSRSRDCSLIKSFFNFYSVNSVKASQDFLLLKIHCNHQNRFSIDYIIDRFRSQGHKDYYEMAELLKNMNTQMSQFRGLPSPRLHDYQVDRCLEKLVGKKAMVLIAPNIVAFTKELLSIGGHKIDDVARSCILSRSFPLEYFMTDDYFLEAKGLLERFDLSSRLRQGMISWDQYAEDSTFRSYSSIFDIKNNRVCLKSKRYNLQPGIVCWEVQQIIGVEELIKPSHLYIQRERYQKQRLNNQIQEASKLYEVKSSNLEQKDKLQCLYKKIQSL